MNFRWGNFTIIYLSLLFAQKSFAQDFSYKLFTIRDGLSGSQVLNVFPDSRGYLWASTEGGISRYDGHTFKNYNLSDGLPAHYSVFDFEDNSGHIWFHYKEGVCEFDGTRFITYPIKNAPKNIWVTEVFCTSNHDKYFVTGNQVFKLQNGEWKRDSLISLHGSAFFNSALELQDHSFLINCLDSLMIRSVNGTYHSIAYPMNNHKIFRGITYTGGDFYIFTYDHLYILKNEQLQLVHDDVLANKMIRTVYVDREHRLWVGTQEYGAYIFSGKMQSHIDPPIAEPYTQHIYSMDNFCEDFEGNIWAATSSGLMKLSPSWVEFYDLQNDQKGVRSSFKDQDGTLYFGQTTRGYMIWKNNKLLSSDLLLDKPSAMSVRNWIGGFALDGQKRLWLTDNNGSLFRITDTHAEDMSRHLGLSLLQYGNNLVFNEQDSTLYVSSANGLIGIRDGLVHEDSLFSAGADRIYTITKDPAGNIWMGTGNGKIFEKRGRKIYLLDQVLKLDKVHISKIKCPNPDELWIATEGEGIYKFSRSASGHFVNDLHITNTDGLPNDHVIDFTFDNLGKVWIITLAGLASFQPHRQDGKENLAITTYGEQYGFRTTFFLYSSLVNDDAGNIWLVTEDYFAKIHSDRISTDTTPPIIHIEDARLFNSNVLWSKYTSAFSPFFHLPESPVLPHDQNDIAVDYTAVAFKNPGNISYSYRMDGVNKDWSSSSGNSHVTFGNLSPGKYVFRVRAKKPQSGWSPVEAQFAFIINPPWWGTIWFETLVAAMLIFTGFFLYKFRVKQHVAQIKFEKQMAEVEMKSLRSQMNPHFIFNSLNSIYRFIQLNNTNDASEYLIKFSKLMRLILKNSTQAEVPLEKDLQALQLYMELESARMNHKFSFQIKTSKDLDKENTMIPPLILQPFVENSIWHGMMNKENTGNITVSISKENDMISCVVEDDGIGREKAMQLRAALHKDSQESLGMKLTSDRINLINRSKNTRAGITISDLYDDNKNSIGTKAEIKIPLVTKF